MRAYEGQRSDAIPMRRTTAQKAALVRQLKDQLAGMKPTVATTLRESVRHRIAELELELTADRQAALRKSA